MRRVIIDADFLHNVDIDKCLDDAEKLGDAPICAGDRPHAREWYYAAQAYIFYGDLDKMTGAQEASRDFALRLGLKIEYRSLNGTAKDSQDSSPA